MRTWILSALVLTAATAVGQPPIPKGAPPTNTELILNALQRDKPLAPGSVEEVILNAQRNHPDIRLAEAKRQMADAEVEQAKFQVAQRVAAGFAKVEQAKASLAPAGEYLSAMKTAGTKIEAMSANAQYQRLKAELMAAELELKAATGIGLRAGAAVQNDAALAAAINNLRTSRTRAEALRLELSQFERANKATPGVVPQQQINDGKAEVNKAEVSVAEAQMLVEVLSGGPSGAKREDAVDRGISWLGRTQADTKIVPVGMVADKLTAVIDKAVKLDLKGADLDEAVAAVLKAAGEPSLAVKLPMLGKKYLKEPPTATFVGEMPFTAAVQFVLDEINSPENGSVPGLSKGKYDVYVREYGLLITRVEDAPKDAPTLTEFARQVRAEKPAKK